MTRCREGVPRRCLLALCLLTTLPLCARMVARNHTALAQIASLSDRLNNANNLPLRDALMQLKKQYNADILFEQEVAVGTRSQINLTLLIDNKTLSKAIVVGYGTQSKRDITGSVASVKARDILAVPVTSGE